MTDATCTTIPDEVKADDAPPRRMAPQDALKRLVEGNTRYKTGALDARDFAVGRAERAAAQYPFAAILSCADSRVAPELAFDQGPGDLFVVRLAGNFVNKDGLASLEYAVEFLNVGLIVVMGHTNCGAVAAAIKVVEKNAELPGALPCLIESIQPSVRTVLGQHPHSQHHDHDHAHEGVLDEAIVQNVRDNVERLRTADPLISARVKAGEIDVVGAVYDLPSGEIRFV